MATYEERLAATPLHEKFHCEACDRWFLSAKGLGGHQNAHVNRKCLCEHCGFTCKTAAGLKSHLRGHVRQEQEKQRLAAESHARFHGDSGER